MGLANLSQLNVPFFWGVWQVNQYSFQGIRLRIELNFQKTFFEMDFYHHRRSVFLLASLHAFFISIFQQDVLDRIPA